MILLAEAAAEPSAIREAGAEVSKIEDAASALKIFLLSDLISYKIMRFSF